jgi:nucleotide-binding universal stress UspA family protein
MSTIVVGVDGSSGSIDALRFALDEARLSNATVKVVAAWHVPPLAYGAGWSVPSDDESFRLSSETKLAKALEEAGAADCGVNVTSEVVRGQPAEVLCETSKGADLLVVGSRGLGGFRGLLLGSVSQQCAHHAPCPVVITPPKHAPQDHEDQ